MLTLLFSLEGDHLHEPLGYVSGTNQSNKSSRQQTKDLHWVNHNAVLERVPCTDFDNEKSLADIVNVPNKTFLPTLEDHVNLMKDFDVLVSRVLVEHLPHFQNAFSDAVAKHIPHKYSEKMAL